MGLPWGAVERAFAAQGLTRDLAAAREAWDSVAVREADDAAEGASARRAAAPLPVVGITEHLRDLPTPLRTGSWRTQAPIYRAHQAPCNAGCPAGNDVVGFVQALAQGGVEAAARVLLRTQPLPSVCGRVCPAPCMSACNRAAYDGAVQIRGLERWIGDHVVLAAEPPPPAADRRRVAVVGSGPAGLAAAFALAGAGHEVTLLEGEDRLGGVLRTGIPAYRLPEDVLDRDIGRILALGVNARTGTFLDADGVAALAGSHDAVIVAAGLRKLTGLDAPGVDLPGVVQGIRFLDEVKRGEAPRLRGHVVVAGGGNTAVDCARTALRLGADSVTIAYRRGRKEMPAIAPEIDEAVAEGVRLLLHRQPVRVAGSARVEAVELAEVELGEPDASGRRRPVVTSRTGTIPCDTLLLALGQSADHSVVPSLPNVVTAGDMATGDGTVTHAIGSGRRAADRVLARLAGLPDPSWARVAPDAIVSPAHVRFSHFEVEPPHAERHRGGPGPSLGFDEVNLGLEGPAEASRCFSCGHCTECDTCLLYCPEGTISRFAGGYRVEGDACKGCGMCVAECPRRAMAMVVEASAR
jgi:NADPH-dependent glutamate synthase beta subunit-like oxidoreductase/ferredoxin